jgi:hypothetical protein
MTRLGMALCLFVLATSACTASSGVDGVGEISSGLEPGKRLASLELDEGILLCAATNEAAAEVYSDDLQARALCSVLPGALVGTDRTPDLASCERQRDECIADGTANVGRYIVCKQAIQGAQYASCDATVDEYERCWSAAIRAGANAFAERYSCQAAVAGKLGEEQTLVIPECESLEARCGHI